MEQMLNKIRPYLHLLARQQLEVPQAAQAEHSDIVQETLLRIHRGFRESEARFQGSNPQQFLAWVRQIQQRVILDFQRRGKARKRDLQQAAGTLSSQAVFSDRPDDDLERMERATKLASVLEQLPESQREIIHKRIFDQLSYREISQVTGKPEGSLRVALARAIASLREHPDLRNLLEYER